MDIINRVSSVSAEQVIRAQNNETPPSSSKDAQKQEQDFQDKVKEIDQAVREHLGIENFKLNFSVDSETKTVVVQVLDADTGKVIQEIPPAEILAMAKEMEKLQGVLFNENV